jgi:hypothetical protein
MKVIEFACPSIGSLKIFGDRLHDGKDFFVRSNSKSTTLDYLIFFDSRGLSPDFNTSLSKMLIEKVSELGKTYLLVCRLLNLTIWASLVGFIALNKLEPTKIITSMGFVDFTPKKYLILEEAVRQIDSIVGMHIAVSYFIENYASREGEIIPLCAMRYGDAYRKVIEAYAEKYDLIVLNTPLTDTDIAIERKRPKSFFSAQAESNSFNQSIHGAKGIDFPRFDELHTYAAVHFTPKGNQVIYERLVEFL